eukprot:115642-Prorocentrum_minimum.AAC.2
MGQVLSNIVVLSDSTFGVGLRKGFSMFAAAKHAGVVCHVHYSGVAMGISTSRVVLRAHQECHELAHQDNLLLCWLERNGDNDELGFDGLHGNRAQNGSEVLSMRLALGPRPLVKGDGKPATQPFKLQRPPGMRGPCPQVTGGPLRVIKQVTDNPDVVGLRADNGRWLGVRMNDERTQVIGVHLVTRCDNWEHWTVEEVPGQGLRKLILPAAICGIVLNLLVHASKSPEQRRAQKRR